MYSAIKDDRLVTIVTSVSLVFLRQVDTLLNNLIASIHPVVRESSSVELFRLQNVVSQLPRRLLLSIVKSYVHQNTQELNKKGSVEAAKTLAKTSMSRRSVIFSDRHVTYLKTECRMNG